MKSRYHFLCMALLILVAGFGFAEDQASPAEQKIAAARKAIERSPDNYDAYNQLALAQTRRARETADPKYYDRAEQALADSFRLSPDNLEAERIRIWILL